MNLGNGIGVAYCRVYIETSNRYCFSGALTPNREPLNTLCILNLTIAATCICCQSNPLGNVSKCELFLLFILIRFVHFAWMWSWSADRKKGAVERRRYCGYMKNLLAEKCLHPSYRVTFIGNIGFSTSYTCTLVYRYRIREAL